MHDPIDAPAAAPARPNRRSWGSDFADPTSASEWPLPTGSAAVVQGCREPAAANNSRGGNRLGGGAGAAFRSPAAVIYGSRHGRPTAGPRRALWP